MLEMENETKVKKSLQWQLLMILLYEVEDPIHRKDASLANIQAFDSQGNLVWTVEPPRFSRDFYYNIRFDTDGNILLAYTALSYLAKVNPATGQILDFHLIK
jgi:hypothetical protein